MAIKVVGDKEGVTYTAFEELERQHYRMLDSVGATPVLGPFEHITDRRRSIDVFCEYREPQESGGYGCAIVSNLMYVADLADLMETGKVGADVRGKLVMTLHLIGSEPLCNPTSGLVTKIKEQARSLLNLETRVELVEQS